MNNGKNTAAGPEKTYRFTTFGGVFLPSLLTILGVVMFMRLGTVVGNFGVYGALGILVFAESIALSTGLAISAISTNTPVQGGGPYFLISRSLGPGFGTSAGIVYFVSQSFSVPFYVLGFAEALTVIFPALAGYRLILALTALALLFLLAVAGTDQAIRVQYGIFAVLTLSILAMGGSALHASVAAKTFFANLAPNAATRADPFSWTVAFAVFFPAVTGFLSGVNLSGDLADPAKSIPRGTLGAIFTGFVIYLVEILLFGAAFDRNALAANAFGTLIGNALYGTRFLLFAGVAAATLSSALGTLIGAPRILQAFAADNIFPSLRIFARGRKGTNDPLSAMFCTLAISVGTIFWAYSAPGGDALNAVAGLVTMFTLSTYLFINAAAAVENFAANPSFRSKFRFFHWSVGIYGALASIAAAVFIHALFFFVAFAIVGVLFFIARRKSLSVTFGDARRGYFFEHIRRSLMHLAQMPPDAKNWRPIFLILVGTDPKHKILIRYGSWLGNERGILSAAQILDGDDDPEGAPSKRRTALENLRRFSERSGILFFPTVIAAAPGCDRDQTLDILLQSRTFGPLTPNIVLAGWPSREERIDGFFPHLQTIRRLKLNTLLLANAQKTRELSGGTIDVWWRGRRNGSLMLILAHLLRCNPVWHGIPIRLLRLASEAQRADAENELHSLVQLSRIDAECRVISDAPDFAGAFRRYSRDAAVIFLGFLPPEKERFREFYDGFSRQLDSMPTTFLVSSAGDTALDS